MSCRCWRQQDWLHLWGGWPACSAASHQPCQAVQATAGGLLQACSQELWQLFMCQFEALRGRTDTPLLDEALTQIYQVRPQPARHAAAQTCLHASP